MLLLHESKSLTTYTKERTTVTLRTHIRMYLCIVCLGVAVRPNILVHHFLRWKVTALQLSCCQLPLGMGEARCVNLYLHNLEHTFPRDNFISVAFYLMSTLKALTSSNIRNILCLMIWMMNKYIKLLLTDSLQ